MKITQTTKQSKSSEISGKKHDTRWKKGQSGNPKGKPVGTKSFSTLMDIAVKEIAKLNKITESEVSQVLIKRGYSEAKDGNYPFFKDLLDRYYGKAKENFDIKHELSDNLIDIIKNAADNETRSRDISGKGKK